MSKSSRFPQGKPSHMAMRQQIRKHNQPQPPTIQPKIVTIAQKPKLPVAPPVYRPQPTPNVLQGKMAQSQPKTAPIQKRPAAPPVYRPQPVPKVLQAKMANARQPRPEQVCRQTAAPTAYRPQAMPGVLQTKEAETHPSRQLQSQTTQRTSGSVLMKGRTPPSPPSNHPIQMSRGTAQSPLRQNSGKTQVIQRVYDPVFKKDIPERWATITPGLYERNIENKQRIEGGNYTFVGYHGTSITHASAILRGINPPEGGANSGEHLGPGFYVTRKEGEATDFAEVVVFGAEPEGPDDMDPGKWKAWEKETQIFKEQKKKYGGKSTMILQIYAQNFGQMSHAEFEKGKQLSQMQTMMEQNDYFVNPGSQSSLDEIKFNKRAYNKLIAIMAPAQ